MCEPDAGFETEDSLSTKEPLTASSGRLRDASLSESQVDMDSVKGVVEQSQDVAVSESLTIYLASTHSL